MKMKRKVRIRLLFSVLFLPLATQPACKDAEPADDTDKTCPPSPSTDVGTDTQDVSTDTQDVSTDDTEVSTESDNEDTSSLDRWPGPGCGVAPESAGEQTLSFDDESTPYYVVVPDNYDEDVPTPVVYVFHGYGRTHTEMRVTDSGSLDDKLGSWAVTVYPKSVGEGWDSTSERNLGLKMFEALHRRIMSDFCVDPERVFATGLSSGGYFTNTLACKEGSLLRGIAPVSGATEDQQNCRGSVAAIVINGMRDSVVPTAHGWEARDYYVRENNCADSTTEGSAEECVAYEGCNPNYPVEWCTHDEPTYEDTNHGWPSFASDAIDTFFKALPAPYPVDNDTNLLEGVFDLNDGWSVYAAGAQAEGEMQGDQICITIASPGTNDWDVQFLSPLFEIKDEQTYILDFKAWSDRPTEVRVRVGQSDSPYTEFWTGRMKLGLPARFVREFTMSETDEQAANLAFQLGGALAGQTPLTVCFYDVVLVEKTL